MQHMGRRIWQYIVRNTPIIKDPDPKPSPVLQKYGMTPLSVTKIQEDEEKTSTTVKHKDVVSVSRLISMLDSIKSSTSGKMNPTIHSDPVEADDETFVLILAKVSELLKQHSKQLLRSEKAKFEQYFQKKFDKATQEMKSEIQQEFHTKSKSFRNYVDNVMVDHKTQIKELEEKNSTLEKSEAHLKRQLSEFHQVRKTKQQMHAKHINKLKNEIRTMNESKKHHESQLSLLRSRIYDEKAKMKRFVNLKRELEEKATSSQQQINDVVARYKSEIERLNSRHRKEVNRVRSEHERKDHETVEELAHLKQDITYQKSLLAHKQKQFELIMHRCKKEFTNQAILFKKNLTEFHTQQRQFKEMQRLLSNGQLLSLIGNGS